MEAKYADNQEGSHDDQTSYIEKPNEELDQTLTESTAEIAKPEEQEELKALMEEYRAQLEKERARRKESETHFQMKLEEGEKEIAGMKEDLETMKQLKEEFYSQFEEKVHGIAHMQTEVEEGREETDRLKKEMVTMKRLVEECHLQLEEKEKTKPKEQSDMQRKVEEFEKELVTTKQLVEEYHLQLEEKEKKEQSDMQRKVEEFEKEIDLLKTELVTTKRLVEDYRLEKEENPRDVPEEEQNKTEFRAVNVEIQGADSDKSLAMEQPSMTEEGLVKKCEPMTIDKLGQDSAEESSSEPSLKKQNPPKEQESTENEKLETLSDLDNDAQEHVKDQNSVKKAQESVKTCDPEKDQANPVKKDQDHIIDKQEPVSEEQEAVEHVVRTKSEEEILLPPTSPSISSLSSLTWRQAKAAPEPIGALHGTVVVHGNTAYFSRHFNVYSYQLPQNEWSKLCPSQYQSFSLAVIDNQLTTIGGTSRDLKKRTKCLFTLVRTRLGKKWKEQYPPMLTHRVFAATLTTPTHLVVAGGRNRAMLDTIEVMNRETFQWSTATKLPEPIGHPQITLCCGLLYISKQQALYCCSLEQFLQSCYTQPTGPQEDKELPMWKKLPDVPTDNGHSLSTLGEQVLAIGGQDSNDKATGVVYKYDVTACLWKAVSELPTARADTLAAELATGELVVVGGWSDVENYKTTEIAKC